MKSSSYKENTLSETPAKCTGKRLQCIFDESQNSIQSFHKKVVIIEKCIDKEKTANHSETEEVDNSYSS